MRLSLIFLGIVCAFAIGFVSSAYVNADSNFESPLSALTDREKISPSNIIKESQIMVYPDKVIIYMDNPQWASYTNTNSMDPVIDEGANGLEFVPKNPEDVNIGDIATYETDEGYVVHRVVEKKLENGKYFYRFKGDNNQFDDGWVEFNDIKYVTCGVIY